MNYFSLTMLVCVITLNAGRTEEEAGILGFHKNWEKREADLILQAGNPPQPIIIDKNHVPANRILPKGLRVFFPVPAKDFLRDNEAINFETDGTFECGTYCEAENNGIRRFWSKVRNSNGEELVVPTAHLLISLSKQLLIETKKYEENWKEHNTDLKKQLSDGSFVIIDKKHVPTYESLPEKTEIYFPVPAYDFLADKNALYFKTDGTYKHGYYHAPETGSLRMLWSIVEDDNGALHTVPTARLMIHA